MKKQLILGAICATTLVLGQSAKAQVTIAGWNFQNLPIAVNNSPAASTGSGVVTPIGMNIFPTPALGVTAADVLAGVTGDTGVNGNSNLTQVWRVRATTGGNGWSSLAPIGSQGAVFAASTVGYTGITFSFDWYTTTQGEANLALEYTTNGTTFQNIPVNIGGNTGISLQNNSSSPNTVTGPYLQDNKLVNPLGGQNWFIGLNGIISDPLAANNPLFAIEMVNASTGADDVSTQGTPLNNTSGNWRFDNVVISGTVAAPEPTSLGLLALGAVGFLNRRRRKTA